MSPNLKDYYISFSQLLTGERVASESRAAAQRSQDIEPYLPQSSPLRVLDLANGRLQPQYLLLKAEGRQVYGIDLVNHPPLTSLDHAYRLARWLYTFHIPETKKWSKVDRLVCGDVGYLPYQDKAFDLVTSIAAFEHFLDVPRVVAELKRVLRPGGVGWIGIHPFTCPSGGHNVTATEIPLQKLPPGVDAWDHLRQRRLPFNVPLNQWRISQYLEVFSAHFEILHHYCLAREGQHLLSEEIKEELASYSIEELICLAYVIILRKAG
jgi:SAM-dependent methyltransferase